MTQMRIKQVQEWILQDWTSIDIVLAVDSLWQIGERQARRYISEAKKRWIQEEDELTENKRKFKVASLKRLKNTMQRNYLGTPAGMLAILQVEKTIISLEGLNRAKKIELAGTDGEPIKTTAEVKVIRHTNVDYTQLPEDALLAIVKARKVSDD